MTNSTAKAEKSETLTDDTAPMQEKTIDFNYQTIKKYVPENTNTTAAQLPESQS